MCVCMHARPGFTPKLKIQLKSHAITQSIYVCLFVFNVPSTARSFRDVTPIYCPLRRT